MSSTHQLSFAAEPNSSRPQATNMAQPRRRYFNSRTRPVSADFEPRAKDSLLYSILPSAVQVRLPRLLSLRRSPSMYGLTTPQKSTESIPSSASSSGISTPRPGYMNAMVLSSAVDDAGSSGNSVSSDEEEEAMNKKELIESHSGISWKFANQGNKSPFVASERLMAA